MKQVHYSLLSVAALEALFFDVSMVERVIALELRARNRGRFFNWQEPPAIDPILFAVARQAVDDLAEVVGADASLCRSALEASQCLSESMFTPMAEALEGQTVGALKAAFRDILEREWRWTHLEEGFRLRVRDVVCGVYIYLAIHRIHREGKAIAQAAA